MQPTGRYLGGEAALDADVREEVALDIEVASRPRPDSSSLLFSRSPSIRAKSRLTAAYAALNRLEKQLNFEENKPENNEAVVAKLDAELDAVDAMLDAAAASQLVSSLSNKAEPEPPPPHLPSFKLDLSAVRPKPAEPVAPIAAPPRPPSPTIPKIPNFAKALSGSSTSSALSNVSAGGSLSARAASPATPDSDLRRPLTARPAHTLGVTTPRGTAMVGPRPGDRSMRGMDDVLSESALRTPRAAVGLGGENGTPGTPRTPRSPRGSGMRSARKRGDDCVVAPPPPRSPRGAANTSSSTTPNTTSPATAAVASAAVKAPSWLHAALEAACSEPSAWLRNAAGATVLCTAGAAILHGNGGDGAIDVTDGGDDAPTGQAGSLLGVVVGAAPGSNGEMWRVEFAHRPSSPLAVPADSLHRVPPDKGQIACAVLGESARLMGLVLSVDNGVAVMRTVGNKDPYNPTAKGVKRVAVLPIDALCRVDSSVPISPGLGSR